MSQIILLEYKSFADNDDELVPVLEGYKIIKFTSTEIVLNFNFTNPLLVSSSFKKDLFSVKIISNEYFMAKSDMTLLAKNYTISEIEVPTQVMSGDDFQNVISAGSGA